MKFIKLLGIGGHNVLINADHIRDVRWWPGPTTSAVITDKETYLVTDTLNQIAAKIESSEIVA